MDTARANVTSYQLSIADLVSALNTIIHGKNISTKQTRTRTRMQNVYLYCNLNVCFNFESFIPFELGYSRFAYSRFAYSHFAYSHFAYTQMLSLSRFAYIQYFCKSSSLKGILIKPVQLLKLLLMVDYY